MAYLMDRFGYIPYLDFFDVNTPGTHLLHYLAGKVFGYTDLSFRIADLTYLLATLILIVLFMKSFGREIAWFAAIAFGLVYFRGTGMLFQRDYVLILPIALAVVSTFGQVPISRYLRIFLVGALLGIAATIKPQSIIGLPAFVVYEWVEIRQEGTERWHPIGAGLGLVFLAFAGVFAPVAVTTMTLWYLGALPSFLDTALNYWPLYGALTGEAEILSSTNRIAYFARRYTTFGGFFLLLVPAVMGLYLALFVSDLSSIQKRRAVLLAGLTVVYSLYALIGGKFWTYHWAPFVFFCVMPCSLCLAPAKGAHRFQAIFPVGVVLICLAPYVVSPTVLISGFTGRSLPHATSARVSEISAFLKQNSRPQDEVQAFDWTGGALHAMLRCGARPGTSFLYDTQFYHHVSSRYIQGLRRRLISELETRKPRFLIQVGEASSRLKGPNAEAQIDGLHELIGKHYRLAQRGGGYLLYERIE
ncbi:MAG: hypothetical protein FJ118_16465 [Deltaproteobacteria bacterium]|nr:hypothetical protein [Deltaproteobacteria bacterium]